MKRIKPGVNISGLRPEILLAWDIVDQIYELHDIKYCWMTSGLDSNHSWGSLHFSGLAIDIRIHNIPSNIDRKAIVSIIKDYIGNQYDVILESDHIHIEFQPKEL